MKQVRRIYEKLKSIQVWPESVDNAGFAFVGSVGPLLLFLGVTFLREFRFLGVEVDGHPSLRAGAQVFFGVGAIAFIVAGIALIKNWAWGSLIALYATVGGMLFIVLEPGLSYSALVWPNFFALMYYFMYRELASRPASTRTLKKPRTYTK